METERHGMVVVCWVEDAPAFEVLIQPSPTPLAALPQDQPAVGEQPRSTAV